MENSINLKIDLPPDIIKKLENVIIETVTKTLREHLAKIKAEPKNLYAKGSCQRFACYTSHAKGI